MRIVARRSLNVILIEADFFHFVQETLTAIHFSKILDCRLSQLYLQVFRSWNVVAFIDKFIRFEYHTVWRRVQRMTAEIP